jgi:hypothetical protein
MYIDFADYDLTIIFPISVGVILLASEIGRWFGGRATRQAEGGVSTLVGAMLGLLALMIGFTFAMALSRFDARRDGVLKEANSIGTAALRARLLPAPHDKEALKLFRAYVQLRLDLAQRPATLQDLSVTTARSAVLQEALWQQAKAVTAVDKSMVPTGLFIQALNEVIDDQEKRLAAVYNRLPIIVLIALYGMAVVAIGFAGYATGLQEAKSRLPVFITGIAVASMVLLIQDIDRPNAGFIRVSQQPMINAAAAIAAYPD